MTNTPPLTHAQAKVYASLATAKGRKQTGLFMAQGSKCVADTLPHFQLEELLCTHQWAEANGHADGATIVGKGDLQKITTLTSTPEVIAIYRIPQAPAASPNPDALSVALDCVQDPGNLGTIMRVCDWMGVTDIFASADTVDVWSPKVVQSTMGSIARVKVHYADDLARLLADAAKKMEVYGTFLDGEDIYHSRLQSRGIVVMGNEGSGIGDLCTKSVTRRLLIPSYPPGRDTCQSLNVAIATAITLSEFRRNG